MGLLKTRPEIRLLAPRTLAVGRPFRASVVLTCAEAVPVDALSVELVGLGVWYSTSQHGRHRNELVVVRLVGRPLEGRALLDPGEHPFTVAFEIPSDAPPSYAGGFMSVEWEYRVRADIPWWPDAKATFVAHVAPHERISTTEGARVFVSDTDGPVGTKPYAEVSLGEVVSGMPLEGTIALSNTEHNDYQALEFRLTACESVPTVIRRWTETHVRASWKIPLSSPGENELIRFRLKLPPIVPAFETRKLELKWKLEVRLCLSWSLDPRLWIPLEVQTRAPADDGEAIAPLAVGNDRLVQIWRQAGRPSGFNYRDGRLSRESGVARLEIRREHRGRRGLRLVAEARYPDQDLGLRAEGGRIRCRDDGQSDVLEAQTDAVLGELELDHADDERMRFVLDDPGARYEPVAEFARRFGALWDAFEGARELLPAPADMIDAVPQFRAAARRLGGELDVASMDVRGSRYEAAFALEVQWDGERVARTVLEVKPPMPIDGRWHHSWDGAGELGPLPEGLQPLTEGADAVSVDAERIRLVFPPCGADVHPMTERLEAMLEVARRLSGHGPGYR